MADIRENTVTFTRIVPWEVALKVTVDFAGEGTLTTRFILAYDYEPERYQAVIDGVPGAEANGITYIAETDQLLFRDDHTKMKLSRATFGPKLAEALHGHRTSLTKSAKPTKTAKLIAAPRP